MNRTIIETFDYTFNPVTGCNKGCSYCYARGIADRFGKHLGDFPMRPDMTLAKPGETFPFGFYPTFYPHRLSEPVKVKKPSRIFVCSMADLLGDWVPREWIVQVIEAMKAAPQHTYFLLTKNPARYSEFSRQWLANVWLGTTIENQAAAEERIPWLLEAESANLWVSCEPLFGRIDLTHIVPSAVKRTQEEGDPAIWINAVAGHVVGPDDILDHRIRWVVVGSMTGLLAKKNTVDIEWLKLLAHPMASVFMKDSLADI